uniref:Uncharacterized protein n=1 Tax=Laticauda laticaudata TaxID=8630 RepID=A0A8C5SF66_LATLA
MKGERERDGRREREGRKEGRERKKEKRERKTERAAAAKLKFYQVFYTSPPGHGCCVALLGGKRWGIQGALALQPPRGTPFTCSLVPRGSPQVAPPRLMPAVLDFNGQQGLHLVVRVGSQGVCRAVGTAALLATDHL